MGRLRAFVLMAAMSMVASACVTPSETAPTSTTVATSTTTSTTTADAPLGRCVRVDPKPGAASPSESIVDAYNRRDADYLAAVLGDGPVRDPSLDPLGDSDYVDIKSWIRAASAQDDVLRTYGYGFGEPFRLYVFRSNRTLSSRDIEGVSVTLTFWVSQDCEYRVDSSASTAWPDACRYADELVEGSRPECLGPFDPRASHIAELIGTDVFVFGGTSGSEEGPLDTGFVLDPVGWIPEPIPPISTPIEWWPIIRSAWIDDELLVVGRRIADFRPVIFSYDPSTSLWSLVTEFPDERSAIGAMVWTGHDLIFIGGELHYASDTAWAFTPASGEWRLLPDPRIPAVEQIEGVWTGSEALFFGGYTTSGNALGIAFDPVTETWHRLPEAPYRSIQRHRLVWTGERLIVASGHADGGHPDTLLVYDPTSDSWSLSSPMPISPSERGAVVWTGAEVIIWGGYATYGDHHVNGIGAAYDPETDQWRVLPPSPLAPRCDHTGTWTGEVVVILGGFSVCGSPGGIGWSDGAIYDPQTNEWTLIEGLRIPELMELRPIDPLLAVSPDWVSLDPGPLSSRWPAVVAWTGQEMVFWGGEPIGGGDGLRGGAAFAPGTGVWREMSAAPLPAVPEASWVWTGEELVIWTEARDAAAWNPTTNSWRSIESWPLSGSFNTLAVWTGNGVLDLSGGLIIDPQSGASQGIAAPPSLNSRASVVGAGDFAVVVTGEGAYNLPQDHWVDMPPSGLTPLATAGVWTGSEVMAVDYLMHASAYEPSNNTWTTYPNLPLRFSECAPIVHAVEGVPVVSHCSGLAVWKGALSSWLPIGTPHATARVDTFVGAEDHIYAWGEGFYRLDAKQMVSPSRLAVGIGFLDLPEGWAVLSVSSGTRSDPDRESFVELILQRAGATCTVRATHADSEAVLARASGSGAVIGELTPNAGGAPWQTLEFLPGPSSGQYRIVWAAGTTDVFDVSCNTRDAVKEIAPSIWTAYQ